MKLSAFIIKEEKTNGLYRVNNTNEKGHYVGDVTPRYAFHTVEFRLFGNEILAKRHDSSKTYYDIITEGSVIGRFFKSGSFRSDIELTNNGSIIQFSIFSNAGYKTAKVLMNGIEIGLLSTKKNFLKEEYGLAINANEHSELILAAVVLHVQYQKYIMMNDLGVFI